MNKSDERIAICCGEKSGVIDTRVNDSSQIIRRRECAMCGDRWSTTEISAKHMGEIARASALVRDVKRVAASFDDPGEIDSLRDRIGELEETIKTMTAGMMQMKLFYELNTSGDDQC